MIVDDLRFAPLDDVGAQFLFASWPPPTSAVALRVPLAFRVLGPLPAGAHHGDAEAPHELAER